MRVHLPSLAVASSRSCPLSFFFAPASPASRLRLKETFHVAAPPVEAVCGGAGPRIEQGQKKQVVQSRQTKREERRRQTKPRQSDGLLATSLGRSCAC